MAKNQILIAGASAQGKSMSLKYFRNPERVAYFTAEAGKGTPFANKFKKMLEPLKDPHQVFNFIATVEKMPEIETIVIDGFNYLMDMYETLIINNSSNKQAAWGSYGDFIKRFFQEFVGPSQKNFIVIAHNHQELQADGLYNYYVPVKGAASKTGIESYFNIVVYARALAISQLNEYGAYDENLIHISPKEERLGKKYVFQLQGTRDLPNAKIRDLEGMWQDNQIYMDNNAQLLLDYIHRYFDEQDNG